MANSMDCKARPNTRERILAACRELFNERGPAHVTTAQIAAEVGINEGNLYYHFKRKEQILEALFEAFETALQQAADARLASGDDPQSYRDYLSGWFNLMWEWRFFYRDSGTVYELAPSLRPRIPSLSDEAQEQVRLVLENQRKAGLIDVTVEEIDRLIVNAWIVSTYWIDYLRSRHGVSEVTRDHLQWGAWQVASLFLPYLTPAGRALMSDETQPLSAFE